MAASSVTKGSARAWIASLTFAAPAKGDATSSSWGKVTRISAGSISDASSDAAPSSLPPSQLTKIAMTARADAAPRLHGILPVVLVCTARPPRAPLDIMMTAFLPCGLPSLLQPSTVNRQPLQHPLSEDDEHDSHRQNVLDGPRPQRRGAKRLRAQGDLVPGVGCTPHPP